MHAKVNEKLQKNRGFIYTKVTNFVVNGINFERRLYYWLWNLTTALNLSSSFKKSIKDTTACYDALVEQSISWII